MHSAQNAILKAVVDKISEFYCRLNSAPNDLCTRNIRIISLATAVDKGEDKVVSELN
jgi:hypothetical protein